MTARMKPHTFSLFDPASVINCLKSFKLTCDTNEVHESVAKWSSQICINKTFPAMLGALASAERTNKKNSRSASGETKNFATYAQVAKFFLKTYVTDEVIAQTVFEIMR